MPPARLQHLRIALLGTGVAASLGLLLSWLFFDAWVALILRDAFAGTSHDFLSDLIAAHRRGDPDVRTLSYFLETGHAFLGRLAILSAGVVVGFAALLRHPRPLLTRFFRAETHAFNLAFFRVILFLGILYLQDVENYAPFGGLPEILRTSAPGMGLLFDWLPVNEAWVTGAFRLFQLSCLSAMVGFHARTSALLAVIFGIYALGIPQLYGKIDHYHHLLWFAAILAASPCGDSFSVDALLRRRRQAAEGHLILPQVARAYALPLRCIWLLLGLIYFFPGLWKFALCGPDWALSDNLKYVMYGQWFAHGGYVPPFRLDQYPVLYKGAALTTLIFELSFAFLIFSPRLRPFAVLTGLAFHNMAGVFVRISGSSLQLCYVVFVDWRTLFLRVGRQVYRTPAHLHYDGMDPIQGRLVATLSVLDIFGSVAPVDVRDVPSSDKAVAGPTPAPSPPSLIVGDTTETDLHLYVRLIRRAPLLSLALPLLLLDRLRHGRHAEDVRRGMAPRSRKLANTPSTRPVSVVGVLLIAGNTLYGFLGLHSWPLSVYPTFAGFAKPEASTIEIIARNASGEAIAWDEEVMQRSFSPSRLNGLVRQVLRAEDEAQRNARLRALWSLAEELAPSLKRTRSVALYETVQSTIPELRESRPLSRKLLLHIALNAPSTHPTDAGRG